MIVSVPILVVLLLCNYVVSAPTRDAWNIGGMMDFVDVDRLLIQVLSFLLLWMLVGLVYAFVHQG
jgi:hypothetical protein